MGWVIFYYLLCNFINATHWPRFTVFLYPLTFIYCVSVPIALHLLYFCTHWHSFTIFLYTLTSIYCISVPIDLDLLYLQFIITIISVTCVRLGSSGYFIQSFSIIVCCPGRYTYIVWCNTCMSLFYFGDHLNISFILNNNKYLLTIFHFQNSAQIPVVL